MLPVYSAEDLVAMREKWRHKNHDTYFAMYSTLWGGICTDPLMWQVPIDDHLVHRSDGVFEAAKCVDGWAYCLDMHLERLDTSLKSIFLTPPPEYADVKNIIKECYKAAKQRDVLIRIMISRGPGSFAVNPYDSFGSQMYVTITRLAVPAEEKYINGVKLVTSSVPAKAREYATTKSCSYLQNMLVKKSAVDAQADYAVCFNESNLMTEGATENVAIITKDKELLAPPWAVMLKGTTLRRAMAHANDLVAEGHCKAVKNIDITKDMMNNAAEMFICSCTVDTVPVTNYDGQPVGDGKPGSITKMILERIRKESFTSNQFTTKLDD